MVETYRYKSPMAAAARYQRLRGELSACRAIDYEKAIPAVENKRRIIAGDEYQTIRLEKIDEIRQLEAVWNDAADTAGIEPREFAWWYAVRVEEVASQPAIAKAAGVSPSTLRRALQRVERAVRQALVVADLLQTYGDRDLLFEAECNPDGPRPRVEVYTDLEALDEYRRMHAPRQVFSAAAE